MSYDPSGPPIDFTRAMRGLYFKTRTQLKDQGTYKHIDGHTLELWVRAKAQAHAGREALPVTETGALVLVAEGSKNQDVAHPLLKVIREAEQDAHRYATALKMTPESRHAEVKKDAGKGGKFGGFDK